MILEPAMMNINIVPPVEGYLERVRELTAAHGVMLIFDEVKTGATISPGGATQRFGVQPDMMTLAKASCGGLPGGAIGMTDEARARDRRRHRPPVRHLQRQPAGDGGRGGDPEGGTDRVGLRAARAHEHRAAPGLRRDHREVRPALLHRGHRREGMRRLLTASRCANTATT